MERTMMQKQRQAPFTLIELLVVVAVIAVLASMLLPALSRARAMARRTACMGNLKQIGLALSMYTSDNDGRIPPKDVDRWWHTHRYNIPNQISRTAMLHYTGYHRTPESWYCPSAVTSSDHWRRTPNSLMARLRDTDVDAGGNPNTLVGYTGNSGGAGELPMIIDNNNQTGLPPSTLIFSGCFFDVGDPGSSQGWSTHTGGGFTSLVDGVNVVLLDGSAHWFPNQAPTLYNTYNDHFTKSNLNNRSIWNYVYWGSGFVHGSAAK